MSDGWTRIPREVLEESVRGAVELERLPSGFSPRRLPGWTRTRQADTGIQRMSGSAAGVSLVIETAATRLRLDVTVTRSSSAAHPPRVATFVAEADGAATSVTVADGPLFIEQPDRSVRRVEGASSSVVFELGGDGRTSRAVRVWLPHTAEVTLQAAFATTPVIAAPVPTTTRWTHHGSSISHGSDVVDPRGPWPHQAARALGVELTSLAFAGNAMLDPFVARAIAEHPADVITLKLGINLVNGDAMRVRTFVPALHGFLDIIRAAQPRTPITVISALACPIHESTPGPTREVSPGRAGGTPRDIRPGDGTLTLARTRELVRAVVESRGDAHLLDGLELLGLDDAHHLFDNLHPDQAGHDLIAARFVAAARAGAVPGLA